MAARSDIALVAQVTVLGNRRAFDELVRRYQSPVRRFLLHLTLGDELLSDDLAQDTFLKAYTHIAQFRAVASFQTWLMRIAYNVFYDHQRREHGKMAGAAWMDARPPVDSRAAASAPPVTTSASSSLRIDLRHALSLLKPDERTCIVLQLVDGYDIRHIARITRMKEGTVKSHLSRGKEKLTTFLKHNGYD